MTFKLIALGLLGTGLASAALEMPSFFSDGMVLQRNGAAKVWGWEVEGAKVTVTFGEQNETAKTNSDGRWEVTFQGLQATGEGQPLTVTSGEQSKTINDVLVGEVWLASGQSNMEWKVSKSANAKAAIAGSEDPFLRVYISPNVAKAEPQIDFPGKWTAASPKTTGEMTAVGYYFAKRLREELQVPVGIIECSWGGKPVEAFISEEALKALPEAKIVLDKKAKAVAAWNPEVAQARFQKALAKWESDKKGRRPQLPESPEVNPSLASTIYQGMIAPLVGYGAKGAIWYQGESNANGGTASIYEELLGCMVADWRKRWGTDLSFYYVQLANFRAPSTEPGIVDDWATVQDEMRRALDSIKSSGMAVTNDIGAANDIHPTNKTDVGGRLARWALAKDYGNESVVVSGPLFKKSIQKDGKVSLQFEHNAGLKTRDGGPLKRFEIKAEDGAWMWAQAKIEGGNVIVWADGIDRPAAVRYAWASNPEGANLVNGEGLPASCFTTEPAH